MIAFAASIWLSANVAKAQVAETPVEEAQIIEVELIAGGKTFTEKPAHGRIDFISRSPDLRFEENTGETVLPPQKMYENLYVYTCICDLNDKDMLGFNISMPGMMKPFYKVVNIKKGQLLEYNVFIRKNVEVKVVDEHTIIQGVNISMIKVTSTTKLLKIKSPTATEVTKPELNDNHTYDYKIYFDLSVPENREREHTLEIFYDKDDKPYKHTLGRLMPNIGTNLMVIVIGRNCYDDQIELAQQHFLNGTYREARDVYKKLVETNDCNTKPDDLSNEQEKVKQLDSLYRFFLLARHHYNRALDFHKNGVIDSSMHSQAEAFMWRNLILQYNPADPYCLEHNREYHEFVKNIGRIVSGKILDNTRIDLQGNNLPIPNTYIMLCTHEKKFKKVSRVEVPVPGKEKAELRKELGRTSVDGSFKVIVPRNTAEHIYRLIFVTGEEDYGIIANEFEYIPTDNDVISGLVIKINPRGRDSINKR
jgi:hypothetical protein